MPSAQRIEIDAFETKGLALRGEMTITLTLQDTPDGTTLHATHEGLPPGVSPADNEMGWRMAMDRLGRLLDE